VLPDQGGMPDLELTWVPTLLAVGFELWPSALVFLWVSATPGRWRAHEGRQHSPPSPSSGFHVLTLMSTGHVTWASQLYSQPIGKRTFPRPWGCSPLPLHKAQADPLP
jgi:hypothetical protein